MIPVNGYAGLKVAVLGLGRSGLATAAALQAGAAERLLWDDSPEARAAAELAGFACTDLTRAGALDRRGGADRLARPMLATTIRSSRGPIHRKAVIRGKGGIAAALPSRSSIRPAYPKALCATS